MTIVLKFSLNENQLNEVLRKLPKQIRTAVQKCDYESNEDMRKHAQPIISSAVDIFTGKKYMSYSAKEWRSKSDFLKQNGHLICEPYDI